MLLQRHYCAADSASRTNTATFPQGNSYLQKRHNNSEKNFISIWFSFHRDQFWSSTTNWQSSLTPQIKAPSCAILVTSPFSQIPYKHATKSLHVYLIWHSYLSPAIHVIRYFACRRADNSRKIFFFGIKYIYFCYLHYTFLNKPSQMFSVFLQWSLKQQNCENSWFIWFISNSWISNFKVFNLSSPGCSSRTWNLSWCKVS